MGKTQFHCVTLALTKTIFLLIALGNLTQAQVLRVKDGVFADTTNQFTPVVIGGSVVGNELVFGNNAGNEVKLYDNGALHFTGGFTLTAELYFEQPPTNYALAMKVSSMSLDFKNSKLNSSWMSFPSEPIFTNKSAQFNYFPVGTELLNGYTPIPTGQWVKFEVNYDESVGVTTTKINGVVDRYHVRYRGKEKVWNVPNQPLHFLYGATNVRVRELTIRNGQPTTNPANLNVYINGLPFRNQLQITFDQIDRRLPLPITATVYLQRLGQLTKTITLKLNTLNRKDTLIPMPAYTGVPMNVKVKTKYWEKDFTVTNRTAPSPYTDRFPIVMYHAQPEDFRLLSTLGVSVVLNDFNVMSSGLPTAEIQQSLDSALKYNMKVIVVANSGVVKLGYVALFKTHPALYGWYIADEPSGAFLTDSIRIDNNAVKMIDEKKPTLVMMNNFNRLQGLDCDIIGVDPWPIPNISLRMVSDAVKAGLAATNDTKPVMCITPHKTDRIPTLEEMRCMAWLGIIAGASSIGMFEFDHRSPATPTGYYAGSYPDHLAKIGTVYNEVRSWDWLLNAKAVLYSPTNLALHACTKTANGKTYLLLANDSRKAETGSLTIGGKTISLAMNPLEVRMVDTSTLP